MQIRFWGVRGSLPTPLTSDQIQAKIISVVSKITPKDLVDDESRMRFISSLPPGVFGTVGGNTACVELEFKNGTKVLLDCGSGLRAYSQNGRHPENKVYHIFLSHYHWDHIQGFPFFGQSYDPSTQIHIYSNYPDGEKYLSKQSSLPYFPENGCWKSVKKQITFHLLNEGEEFELEGVKINSHKMKHPGDSYAFSFVENGKKFIYCTDTELQLKDFDIKLPENQFFKDADILVLDSQYTNLEAIEKENWGHSSFGNAIDFATLYNVKNLYFFHHEPTYDDRKLFSILEAGRLYKTYNSKSNLSVYLAQEGKEIEL